MELSEKRLMEIAGALAIGRKDCFARNSLTLYGREPTKNEFVDRCMSKLPVIPTEPDKFGITLEEYRAYFERVIPSGMAIKKAEV
ncbi:MAG: hypothetical protein WC998_03940 [Candidatus Paceibacterota bacterium]